MNAQLLTTWTGTGLTTATARRPQFAVDYPGIAWRDVTGTLATRLPPTPNACVIEIACTSQQFATIAQDARYQNAIQWDDVSNLPDAVPPDAEHAAALLNLTAAGFTSAQADAAIGSAVNGRTRRQVTDSLSAWLKTL
jgi:hypothetical protein